MALSAPAKVNLALHVIGRRADGYHFLDSIAVFADVGERVTIAPAEELTLSVTGRFAAHAPADESDLAHRAASAFFARAGLPPGAAITVDKAIPAGAGLGGGSADAAAVLLGLNRITRAGLPFETLAAIALTLGADVPMCLAGRGLRARGVGEEINRLAGWPALPLVIVWPGTPVSTAAAFKALARRDNEPLPGLPVQPSLRAVAAWLATCRNDLEAPAIALVPEIALVLENLGGTEGCLLARMSGSGSACFGLYSDMRSARAAAAAIARDEPEWWCVAGEAS